VGLPHIAATRWDVAATGLLVFALAFVDARPGYAEIYRYVDARGHVHFSDRKLGPGYLVLDKKPQARFSVSGAATTRQFSRLILHTAREYQVDPALVHAVVTAESGYNPEAISKAGAVGLMQLMPATARRYGVQDRRDPAENLRGGVRYLQYLLTRFKTLPLALAAYNAGENAVVKYGHQIPPYPETEAFVRKVLNYYRAYQLAS
jgi:soluble lytic murein transglycosylase-like protein